MENARDQTYRGRDWEEKEMDSERESKQTGKTAALKEGRWRLF